MAKRISHQANFKGKVALEALKEEKTLSDLAQELNNSPIKGLISSRIL